ncbi:ACP S-malonyltransferase [Paenibacillus lutimineralis]|uniref:[acyl-carrier-protein] S-malonyltransferase n=1 Tax=Paenibacillus lutimineralis TaxID=2707005 RepID=A0A3Q9IBD6_9BACL|nr:ACP S-malonyltransferase [Paenibacillus lutimineralis]AZS16827.1 [acyl-carrier-protein] S-malonyltransferase [Paenibacillus lutimineralis]
MLNKHAIWFPGQGSQRVGMGKALSERHAIVKATMEEANEALGMRLDSLMYEGTMTELTRTDNAQPAILALGVAMYRVYSGEWGYLPAMAAGHSLGEITALTCAGAIAFPDALRLVRRRGELMQEAAASGIGAMAAVNGPSPDVVAKVCMEVSAACVDRSRIVVVSNMNSESQTVISGHKEAVHEASERLSAHGATVIPLQVSAPFHSPLMAPAAAQFAEVLSRVSFGEMDFPVVSSLTGLPYGNTAEITGMLARGLTDPVNWPAVLAFQKSIGVATAVELGPGNVLKRLAPPYGLRVFAFDDKEDEANLVAASGQTEAYSIELLYRCLAIATCVRNRNWNAVEYEQGVVLPYRGVQQLVERLRETGEQVEEAHVRQALAMLESVFRTKGTSAEEQERRLARLQGEFGLRGLPGISTADRPYSGSLL